MLLGDTNGPSGVLPLDACGAALYVSCFAIGYVCRGFISRLTSGYETLGRIVTVVIIFAAVTASSPDRPSHRPRTKAAAGGGTMVISLTRRARRWIGRSGPWRVEAAYTLIAEKGFEGLRTREVATRIGINSVTLHYYSPTKEALI